MDSPSSFAKRPAPSYPGTVPARFEDLARLRDSEIDVALGGALIARDVYPDLDVASVIERLDRIAAPLFSARLEQCSAEEQVRILNERIYGDEGFRGNESDYYDPRNSLLSDVLTRKLGIPLTLAIVYCEVARRVGRPGPRGRFSGSFSGPHRAAGARAPAFDRRRLLQRSSPE